MSVSVPWANKFIQKSDKVYLAVGSSLSTLVALVISVGIANIFRPHLNLPLQLHNDSIWNYSVVMRVSEGWNFNNIRQGFPFGSESRAFPIPDNGSLLILKCLTAVGFSAVSSLNIYFLIGFPVCFCVTYLVLRHFKASAHLSFAGATLYTFLPFHFYRFEHFLYTWYFTVPIFFVIAEGLFRFKDGEEFQVSKNKSLLALMLLLSSFGVYFSVFGSSIVLFGAALGYSRRNAFQLVKKTTALLVVLASGLVINVLPNIWFLLTTESSLSSSVIRSRTAGEIYSFRLIQLLLPNQDHVFRPFRSLTASYNSSAPFVNENHMSTLGIFGSIGFIVLLLVLFFRPKSDEKSTLWFLASTSLLLFLIGTNGGFGSIATYLGLEMLRGWNRISVFIAFGCIAGICLSFQFILKRKWHVLTVSIFVIGFGLLDQVGGFYVFRTEQVKNEFFNSQKFVGLIENSLPVGSAVYNLPYTDFPEPNPTGGLAYENGEGFLYSKSLKWSYGANKSTEGAKFFGSLGSEPLATQMRVIKRLGFNGVYLDLRGFGNEAEQVKEDFLELGLVPMYERADGNVLFFRIIANRISKIESLDVDEIEAVACYQKRIDGSYFESC